MRNILKLLFLTFLIDSHALPASGLCKKAAFPEIKQLANYFGEIDPRQTPEDFAKTTNQNVKEIYKQFAGSGKVSCPIQGESKRTSFNGSLVGSQNQLLIPNHVFYDNDCNRKSFETCSFQSMDPSIPSVEIDLSSFELKKCYNNTYMQAEQDWLVVKLKSPIKKAKPYSIPKDHKSVAVGDQLVQAAGYSRNFKDPHLASCSIVAMDLEYRPAGYRVPVGTDCPSAPGTSGASQLRKNGDGNWELVSIHSWTNQNAKDGDAVNIRKGFFNKSTQVAGELWEELNRRANESN